MVMTVVCTVEKWVKGDKGCPLHNPSAGIFRKFPEAQHTLHVNSFHKHCRFQSSDTQMPRILLLSSQPVLPGSIVKDLLEKGDADLAKIDIITNSGTLKPGLLAKDRYAAVFAFAEEAALHNLQFLSELQKSLASGGEVTIVERGHTVMNSNHIDWSHLISSI